MTDRQSESTEKTASDYLLQNDSAGRPPKQPYNDFPNYYYAGFWIRFFAFIVDLICIQLLNGIVLTLITSITGMSLTFLMGNLLNVVIYLAYFILFTKVTNGQTLGKVIFGIQVVCFKEERLSWQTVLVREGACRFVLQLGFLLVGYLVTAFTPAKQHVGDLFSDTSVVTINLLKADRGVKI